MNIKLLDVVKKYDEKFTLGPINFELKAGTAVGLIGHNGAGKTTLMELICTLQTPTSGTILYDGQEKPLLQKSELCFIPTTASVPNYLTGIELIHYTLALNKVNPLDKQTEIEKMLMGFHLTEHQHKMVKSYSFGMRRKSLIIALLLLDPKSIILDEPFNGLDFESVEFLRSILMDLQKKGSSILVSSHIKEIIDSLCTEKLILKNGQIS